MLYITKFVEHKQGLNWKIVLGSYNYCERRVDYLTTYPLLFWPTSGILIEIKCDISYSTAFEFV